MNNSLVSARCVAYATSRNYSLKEAAQALREKREVSFFRDVAFVDFGEDPSHGIRGVFLFPYGVSVMWGLTEEEEEQILQMIKPFEEGRFETREKDVMGYGYGEKGAIIDDRIILPALSHSAKLAFSHGLAQSVKLSVFEAIVKKTIDSTKSIPEQLARYGRIPLSKQEIRKKMGELFIERSSINLHFDALDVPEYFWEHADLEPLYAIIATHLELASRIAVLNQRLDVIHDLFEMLGTELNHQHSSKLEWIIILLIIMEVFISLAREFQW